MVKPSRFPPSPIVMYTGAEASFLGLHPPFTILYSTFDILSYIFETSLRNTIENLIRCFCRERERVYGSFVGVDVAGEDKIDLVVNKPRLIDNPHGISFHIVIIVAVVHRGMSHNY